MSMATVYRDYGARSDQSYVDNYANVTPRTQVYQATHKGDGEKNRLPFMNRSFISFTYSDVDGELKHIEDFNLIATISGDRWERDGYTSFNDLTTDYDNLDGLYYWGTHYKSHSITFQLSTDGMDLKQLDDFLHWFRPGVSRELILAEHPNRAQMARVLESPQLSLLPFEGRATLTLPEGNETHTYTVPTTLYKGEITLTLVMDEPHWYAKDNILGTKVTDETSGRTYYTNQWIDANGDPVEIFASLDALKILYEDGIPLGTMIENNMLLGNKAYANVENNVESLIWSIEKDEDIEWVAGVPSGSGARIHGIVTLEYVDEMAAKNPPIIVKSAPSDVGYVGRIAGAIIDASGNGIAELDTNEEGYFYYAGTAPSPTIISFSIMPHFDESTGYFDSINNSFIDKNNPYSTITIESEHILTLKMTTPNLLTSYNKALKILTTNSTSDLLALRKLIRDEIRHPAIRAWVANILSNEQVNLSNVKDDMTAFFSSTTPRVYLPITFSFNSKTGEAVATFYYYDTVLGNIKEHVEDVGDMLKSNGIYISDRNHPNDLGKIIHRDVTAINGNTYSHVIYHDFALPINNLLVIYKNMYL